MHTSQALTSADFEVTVDGRRTPFRVGPGDRLGIVIHDELGAAGAACLVLAAVTAFYDRLRAAEPDGFVAYPDFFAIHVGRHHGTLRKLDVYPEHKEPVVADEPERVLRAINDRAITHLLVPDGPARPLTGLSQEALHSARRRLRGALAYDPSGRTDRADVSVTAPPAAEGFVTAMLGGDDARRAGLRDGDGRPTETFRRLPVDHALGRLATMTR